MNNETLKFIEQLRQPLHGGEDINARLSETIDLPIAKQTKIMNLATGAAEQANEAAAAAKTQYNRDHLYNLTEEIIRGDWGNGATRRKKLDEAGYNYHQVQDLVNKRIAGTVTDEDYNREYVKITPDSVTVEDTNVETPLAPNTGTAPAGLGAFLGNLRNMQ